MVRGISRMSSRSNRLVIRWRANEYSTPSLIVTGLDFSLAISAVSESVNSIGFERVGEVKDRVSMVT